MAKELTPVEISGLPQLSRLVAELRRGTGAVLREHGEDVAVVTVVTPVAPKARTRGRPTTADDPLWNIVGIGSSGGPGDVSQHKYRYLAEAYAPRAPREA